MLTKLFETFSGIFGQFDRLLAYLGGGLLVVLTLLYVLPAEQTCDLAARTVGLPEGVAVDQQASESASEKLKEQLGFQAVASGRCWYYWSESQRTTLGLLLLLAAALVGPLGSALAAPLEWLTDVGVNNVNNKVWARRVRHQSDYIEVARRYPHWFAAALLASGLADREQKSLSLHENLEILVRNAMVSLLVIVFAWLGSFSAAGSVVAFFVLGFVLTAVAGWFLTRARLRMLFSQFLYRAARLDGQPELVAPDGNLPADFDQNPAKWFRELVRRLAEPDKDRRKNDQGGNADPTPSRVTDAQ